MKNYEEFRQKTYLNICAVLLALYTAINMSHNLQHLFFIHEISYGLVTFNFLNLLVLASWLLVRNGRHSAGINILLVALSLTMICLNLFIRQFYNHNNIIAIFPIVLAIFIASKRTALIIAVFNTLAVSFLDFFYRSYDDVICYLILIVIIAAIVSVSFLLKSMIVQLEILRRQHTDELFIATLKILGYVSELRDRETQNHLERVAVITAKLIVRLKKISRYSKYISESYISDVIKASMLHDIGKIGIPDVVLLKPGKLTEEEYDEVRKHTILGQEILEKASREIKGRSIFNIATEIARHHHERWDGTGYPDKLKGYDIPLSARIMAVADVYDALVTERSYKKKISHEEAVAIIKTGSGTQFDPDVVKCFHHVQKDIYNETHRLL